MKRYGFFWILFVAAMILSSPSSRAEKRRWIETQVWSGSGTATTEPFLINGNKWRLRYTPRGMGSFEIKIHDAAGNIIETAAETRELVRGYRTYKDDKGLRYLTMRGIDAKWEVRVEQYVNVIEEWQLTQWLRSWKPDIQPIAVWVGDTTDAEYELMVPAGGGWQVIVTNSSHGSLKASLEGEDGNLPFTADLDEPVKMAGWGYRSGPYKLKVKAENTPWRIEVFSVTFPSPGK